MGKPVLLMRLEGPLQSWGTRSRWDVRDTATEPTKSGVMGLLGCALGYPTYDPRLEMELNAGLRFGVRTEHPGRIVKDFQTITGFLRMADGKIKKIGKGDEVEPVTIVSPRYYLEDAAFLVALEEVGTQPGLLRRCAEALQKPVWPPYLGRKVCVPSRPLFECLTSEYTGIEEALNRHPWSWLEAGGRLRKKTDITRLRVFVEDSNGSYIRQDAIRTNAARHYGFLSMKQFQVELAELRPVSGGG